MSMVIFHLDGVVSMEAQSLLHGHSTELKGTAAGFKIENQQRVYLEGIQDPVSGF